MTPSQQQKIKDAHCQLPEACQRTPATETELKAFENEFGEIPSDYRWYLSECGGGVIGSERINGIEELAATQRKVREAQERGFHSIPRFFAIGWDGSGNPYGYDLDSGHIVTEYYDFGGIGELAVDFYDLLCKKGLIR
jgi:hypothetical protein